MHDGTRTFVHGVGTGGVNNRFQNTTTKVDIRLLNHRKVLDIIARHARQFSSKINDEETFEVP